MIDLLLLAGMALLILSVILGIAAVARTEAPRAAALAFLLGVLALMLGAWLDPDPFRVQDLGAAWARLSSGEMMR